MIHLNNAPYGFSLSAFRIKDNNTLQLLLHRRVVESRELQFINCREAESHIAELNEYGVRSFLPELAEGSRFGFNGSFEVGSWKDDILPLSVSIPTAEEDEICSMCHGKESKECFVCSGSGKDYKIDHSQTLAISATFSVLLGRLHYHNIFMQEGSVQPPLQLLLVSTMTRVDAHGGSLWGAYSIPLVAWLAKQSEYSTLTSIGKTMKLVHKKLNPFSHHLYTNLDFNVQIQRDGWLNISCPGQACGLHPSHHGIRPGRGYEFQCHNVDTSFQQLVLLSALGALTDMAVAEGIGQK